ncbi:MAG: VWA domain-containing protein [Treponema sp.]|nr:VWA domain-containing protein [Treponema sp.]
MPSFQNPLAFLFLLFIPLVFILRKLEIFKKPALPIILADWEGAEFSWNGATRKFMIYLTKLFAFFSFMLIVLALAKPIFYRQEKVYTSRGADVFFVIDISPSMFAKDMGGISRFDSARNAIRSLVSENSGISYGLIALASEAAVVVPPTLSHNVFLSRLSTLTVGSLGDGSAFGTGLSTAVYHLSSSSAPKKCIIFVSDGENNSGSIHPETAAEMALKNGITIYTIGIGTRGTVPLDYTDPITGKFYSGYLQSNFDSALLQKLATLTGGKYYEAQTIAELSSYLSIIGRNVDVAQSYYLKTTAKEYHSVIIFIALILFVLLYFMQRIYLQEFL